MISGVRAINCTNTKDVETYVSASLTTATQRAYLSDLVHFEAWGGSISATPAQVASYLAAHAASLSTATLARRLASVSKAHTEGPLFRPVDRHGRVGRDQLSGNAVSAIIRARLAATGIDPSGFSAHSLGQGWPPAPPRQGFPPGRSGLSAMQSRRCSNRAGRSHEFRRQSRFPR